MIATRSPETLRSAPRTELEVLTARHLSFGWCSLVLFLSLGIGLEVLHGIKAGLYLDVSNHTRRFMWTLAHAHGTGLALVQIAFALTLQHIPFWEGKRRGFASAALIGAAVLVPAGFFLGGVDVHGADPGLGILLVPVGALLLLAAGVMTAVAVCSRRSGPTSLAQKTRGESALKRR